MSDVGYIDRIFLVSTEGFSKVFKSSYFDDEDGGYISSMVVRFFTDFARPPLISLDSGCSFISLCSYKKLLKDSSTVVIFKKDMCSVDGEYDSGNESFDF